MFTGIVIETGTITGREPGEGRVAFRIEAPEIAKRARPGDSIAVNGVCLTATEVHETAFSVDAVENTLSRTTASGWDTGTEVNLEYALAAGEPLGGHIVQGHVDDIGEVTSVRLEGEDRRLAVRLSEPTRRVTVDRGSLTVDGVSLTVARLTGDIAEFAIIPYTWSHTTLRRLRPGSHVNIEADLIGKYVHELVEPYRAAGVAPTLANDRVSQIDTDSLPDD